MHLDTLLDGKGGNATEGPEVWHDPKTVSIIDMQNLEGGRSDQKCGCRRKQEPGGVKEFWPHP